MLGKRVKRWLVGSLLVLAGVLGSLALAELALRTMGLGEPIVYRTNTAYRYAPRPNQRVQRRRGAWVTINESGYRSTEDWTTTGALRVLWIGDSVTWGGTYIDDRQTFAELACKRVEDATGIEAVCGNAAANAYGVDNMVSRLRYDPAGADADVIVAVVGWADLFRSKSNIGGNLFFRDAPQGPLRALRELAAFGAARVLVVSQGEGSCDDAYGPAVGLESLAGLLGALKEEQDDGKTALLVRYPVVHEAFGDADASGGLPYLPWCASGMSALLLAMEDAVRASGVPYLDLTEAAREAVSAESAEPFFYDHWGHVDVRGHRVYAQVIGDKLVELTAHANN